MYFIKVFISHAADDRTLAKAIVDCIEACIDMPDKAIRCTSVPGYRLAPGDVSDEVLRDNLEECDIVIGLLTQKSLKSGYVVMELGAAWGLKKTTCALLAPGVDFTRIPGPLSRKHAIRVDSDHDVASLMELIAEATERPLTNRARSTAAISSLVTSVSTWVQETASTPPTDAKPQRLAASDDDAVLILRTWIKKTLSNVSSDTFAYRDIDAKNDFEPGTAKRVMMRVVQQSPNWRLEEGGSHFTLTYAPPNRPPPRDREA